MLQRSPSYILAVPQMDPIATFYNRFLPARAAYALTRWRNIWLSLGLYRIARRWPEKVRAFMLGDAQKRLGVDAEAMKNFTPHYAPWDQRLCLDPDGGFYAALLKGSASVVTGEIDSFTPDGLRLRDGEVLRADTIISATGLKLQLFGGATVRVDGAEVATGAAMTYKGCMFAGVPNMLAAFGYANASWTLKCAATTRYLVRLLAFMRSRDILSAKPQGAPQGESEPVLTLTSGYVQRGHDILPRQGKSAPWRYSRDYPRDFLSLRFGRIDDGVLSFSRK
jgi:cation diffusion facilitator CzcD-associated flavoprotein CzcO